ncbi:MAG: AraC family transcriptional regulator [Rhodopila sp.]|jgi:AraC family transcriptional regulator
MNPVAKALWFIESHFAEEITLAEISDIAGVSRFHLVRAFGVTTGCSVVRYVRGRRLTEAAKKLAKGGAGYTDNRARRRLRVA